MNSLVLIIVSLILVTVAMPHEKDTDWFFKESEKLKLLDPDFKDDTDNDNDESREFFRSSTGEPDHKPSEDPKDDSNSIEKEITEEPDSNESKESKEEPSSSSKETTMQQTINSRETTADPDTSSTDASEFDTTVETTQPQGPVSSEEIQTTEVDIKLQAAAYYRKRKEQALVCKKNEHMKLEMKEFGKPDCQLCTCDIEGVLICSHVNCADDGSETGKRHDIMLQDSETSNLILREYATDCTPGTKVEAGKCTCTCVLPSVMSCPKTCFKQDFNAPKLLEHRLVPRHRYS